MLPWLCRTQQPATATYTTFLREAAECLFDSTHQGAAYTVFRDLVDRAVSLFYYLQHATWEVSYQPEFQNFTLKD